MKRIFNEPSIRDTACPPSGTSQTDTRIPANLSMEDSQTRKLGSSLANAEETRAPPLKKRRVEVKKEEANEDLSSAPFPLEILKCILGDNYSPAIPCVCKAWNSVAADLHQDMLNKTFAELGPDRQAILEKRIQQSGDEVLTLKKKMELLLEDQKERLLALIPTLHVENDTVPAKNLLECFSTFTKTEQWIKDYILAKACSMMLSLEMSSITEITRQVQSLIKEATNPGVEIHSKVEALRQWLKGESAAKIHTINLNSSLLEIPDEFFGLKLNVLNLSLSNVFHLPENISKLQFLKILRISNGQLTHLPENFSLPQLNTCSLNNNFLEEFPEALCLLPKLEFLYLEGNKIKGIPQSVEKMASLKRLVLCRNWLSSLPDNVDWKQLKQLERLDISSNQLEKIPPSLFDIPNLKELILSNNKLEELPNIKSAANLVKLDISNNPFCDIPEEIKSLSNLKELDISGNATGPLPEETFVEMGLQRLIVSPYQDKFITEYLRARCAVIIKISGDLMEDSYNSSGSENFD